MRIKPNETTAHVADSAHCADVPELKRLRYFYGQMLGVHDFQTEQDYFREKLKLHNRCLHGYGTVCGLLVVPGPRDEDCESEADKQRAALQAKLLAAQKARAEAQRLGNEADVKTRTEEIEAIKREQEKLPPEEREENKPPTRVMIECGLALDCQGNEIIVRRPLRVDLWRYLDAEDRNRVADGATTLYLSVCYCEQPVDPVRPVLADACGASTECTYGKSRDAVKLRVTVDPPKHDARCETCCTACEEPCLLLARIDEFHRGAPIAASAIDNSVRRPIGTYASTTITGISWTHGAEYTPGEAYTLLGTDHISAGLKVTFSRPVLVSTLTRGVIDMCVMEGGTTKRSGMYQLEVEYVGLAGATTREVRFCYAGDETLEPGDRVLITMRCAFVLDECCRPVDGTHVGGRVPILKDEEFKQYDRTRTWPNCAAPPGNYGPWTSGVGTPGGSFESWFYIQKTAAKARVRPEERT